MTSRRSAWAVLGAAVVVVLVWWFGLDGASTQAPDVRTDGTAQVGDASTAPAVDEHGVPWVALASLPPESREVLADIDAGGPYDHPGKDGSTFGNYEGVLPQQRRGYYREYTVETPGVGHRGARRIVTGSGGELYWTADHYVTFERIRR